MVLVLQMIPFVDTPFHPSFDSSDPVDCLVYIPSFLSTLFLRIGCRAKILSNGPTP